MVAISRFTDSTAKHSVQVLNGYWLQSSLFRVSHISCPIFYIDWFASIGHSKLCVLGLFNKHIVSQVVDYEFHLHRSLFRGKRVEKGKKRG